MPDFGVSALKPILAAANVSPPEDCVTYGLVPTNPQGGLGVEDLQKQSVYGRLRVLYDAGVREAWLLRLEWSRRRAGLNETNPADAVRVFPVSFTGGFHKPALAPTLHEPGRLIRLDLLTQSALDRALRDEPDEPEASADGAEVPQGRQLADRSDAEVLYVRKTSDGVMRRRHNSITNLLKSFCDAKRWVVREDPQGYDALIENYVADRDLLIEVKTESTPPFVRMVVGQLLDYRRRVPRRDQTDLAVLLQGRPDDDVFSFLADVGVRLLWLLPDAGGIHGL